MSVSGSTDVVFARCTIAAGDGADLYDIENDSMGRGGVGLRIATSNVSVFDTAATGGDGGSDGSELALSGNDAGAGARMDSGLVISAGSAFTGGQGGHGGTAWQWKGCGQGGDGGTGFSQGAGLFAQLDTLSVGGPGGFGVAAYGCSNGQVGSNLITSGGTQYDFAGPAPGFSVPSPLRVGQPADVLVQGEPGDVAFLVYSLEPLLLFYEIWAGTVMFGSDAIVSNVGVVPAGGTLTVPITPTDFGPGVDSILAHGQVVLLLAGGGVKLGPYSSGLLLAPGF